jgi:hypothetical protein
MKKILSIFLLGFLFSCTSSTVKNDLIKDNLFGNVKSVSTTKYEAVDKFGVITKIEKNEVPTWLQIFNEKGNMIAYKRNKTEYEFGFNNAFKYDDNGNRIESSNYLPDGILDWRYTFKYDDEDNNIERNYYGGPDNELVLKWKMIYDNKGKMIESNQYWGNGHLEKKDIFIYNTKGQLVEEKKLEMLKSLILMNVIKKEYDDKGNKIQSIKLSRNKELLNTVTYKYDSKGNQIEDIYRITDNTIGSKEAFKFDDNNNKIWGYYFELDGWEYEETYEYEFDEKQNWITCITYKNLMPSYITYREIEYYD